MRGLCALVLLLTGCAAQAPQPSPSPEPAFAPPKPSGDYSNFGDAFQAGTPEQTWDLHVRPLPQFEDQAFVVTRSLRETGASQTRLYRFRTGAGRDLELQISLLEQAQDELDPGQLLAWADAQADAGCSIVMQVLDDGWVGQTQPETCRLQDPFYGELGVVQEIHLLPEQISIAVRLVGADGAPVSDSRQVFDRVHEFHAWAGLRRFDAHGQPMELVLSEPVLLRSDGRRQPLREASGAPLDMTLQLSLLEWQPGEPDYLRLDAYSAGSGALMAYYWADPGVEQIEFNSDWLQLWAERLPAQPVE